MMAKVAIIGGTGVYDPRLLESVRETEVKTPYGTVTVQLGKYKGEEVAFIPRHGKNHNVPPHMINYRANIMALKQVGVNCIIATAAVGSLRTDFKPGEFVLADQFLDFTRSRKSTFFEGGEAGVIHCDMTVPYCPEIRQAIVRAAQERGLVIHNGATYVCTEGPRFETSAEIQMFKLLGGHIVGMTSVPEVCLARELGICYANVSIVTNFAAGISQTILNHAEVVEQMRRSTEDVRYLILESIKYIDYNRSCSCSQILKENSMSKK